MKNNFLIFGLIFIVESVNAETINLTWKDGDTVVSGPSSCTYGGTFTPPTLTPPSPGYVLKWIAHPHTTCGIEELDSSINGTARATSSGDNGRLYGISGMQWVVIFDYGVVYGRAMCNGTSGTQGKVSTPPEGSGGANCWCQVTGFTPVREDGDYTGGPECTIYPASSKWMYYYAFPFTNWCSSMCSEHCADDCKNGSYFRNAMFSN